jgi:S-adenosylmethionine-dependent methyltransferase
MNMTVNTGSERFDSGAHKYSAYLGTPEGRLRLDLALANLEDFLPPPHARKSLRALDVGGGTGALSVRLAQFGLLVTLLDSSLEMLHIANAAAKDAGVSDQISPIQGDAIQTVASFPAQSFDLILCHNVLEFIDNPDGLLGNVAGTLRDSAVVSVLVRNQAGEVLKAALQAGDLAGAEKNLNSDCAEESLYGGSVRLLTPQALQALMRAASLEVIAMRGVRVASDYLPPRVNRSAEYERIFELERKLGNRPDFAAVARYIQCLARRATAK